MQERARDKLTITVAFFTDGFLYAPETDMEMHSAGDERSWMHLFP
jgi:hypothetical protein